MSATVLHAGEGKAARIPPSNVSVVFKLVGANTGGQFALLEIEIEPGAFVPPHRHPNTDEYDHVLEGEIMLLIGERIVTAPAGTLVTKPRGVLHAIWNASTQPARFLEVISPAGLEKYFEEAAKLSAVMLPEQFMAWARQHGGGDIDMTRVPELVQEYNLKFPVVQSRPK